MKLICVISYLLFSFAFSDSDSNAEKVRGNLNTTLESIGQALKSKDIDAVKRNLSDDFTLGTYSGANSHMLLQYISDNYNIESVRLKDSNIEIDGDLLFATAEFRHEGGHTESSLVAFEHTGKVCYADYFDSLLGQSRFGRAEHVGTLNFEMDDKSIILTASVNDSGIPLRFLLDTGADGIAVTREKAELIGLQVTRSQNAAFVGGQTQIQISSGNNVQLAEGIALSDQNIAIFENIGHSDGIIGNTLMRRYLTHIDFDKQTIDLYTFGEFEYPKGGYLIPLKDFNSLITIPSVLNLTGDKEVTGNFIMDSGANYHMIAFSRFVRKNRLLLSGFVPEGQGTTVSMGHSTPVFYGTAKKFSIGDHIVFEDMPVTLQASSGVDNSTETMPDGSIGIQLLSQYNIFMDLLNKEIYLMPRK